MIKTGCAVCWCVLLAESSVAYCEKCSGGK